MLNHAYLVFTTLLALAPSHGVALRLDPKSTKPVPHGSSSQGASPGQKGNASLTKDERQALLAAGQSYREGVHFLGRRDFDRAEACLGKARKIIVDTVGEENSGYASTIAALGVLRAWKGQHREAEALLRRAMEIQAKVLGKQHSDYIATITNLGGLYSKTGEREKALALLLQAVNLHKERGDNHIDFAASLNNLGSLYLRMDQYDRAEPALQQAHEIYKKQVGENHPAFADSLERLGKLETSKGDFGKAEGFLRRSLDLRERILPPNHPNLAESLESYAVLLRKMKRDTEAALLEERASRIRATSPNR